MEQYSLTNGLLSAGLAFVGIFGFQAFLVGKARNRAGTSRTVTFMDLVVTSEDESYSLSRLQIYLWTVLIMVGFSAIYGATLKCPVIPETLYILMGLNVAASVSSTAVHVYKEEKKKAATAPDGSQSSENNKAPNFFSDIFLQSNNSLDLPRTQMFAWTIIIILVYVVMLVQNLKSGFNGGDVAMPDIPAGLVALMGVSHGAYLGTKAAEE